MSEPRVLIIDDDDLVSLALYEHLVASSVSVDLAIEPVHAEALMRGNTYALIVMDTYLTGVLHARAAQLLATVHRLCPDARIMLLTAYGSRELAETLSGLHEITMVPKPQSVFYLGEVIDRFLHHGTLPESRSKA